MEHETLNVLVLAAGEGTRMRSSQPKVLHKVAGRPLLQHVLRAAQGAGASSIGVVIGPERDDVRAEALRAAPQAHVFVQEQRKGTGHAVLQAKPLLQSLKGILIIVAGDTPLLRRDNFHALANAVNDGSDIVIGAFKTATPQGYGRIVEVDNAVTSIVEEKDASAAQKSIAIVNSGLIAMRADVVLPLIEAIKNNNAAGEFYLTDIVQLAHEKKLKVSKVLIDESDTLGINTRAQLAGAEQVMQRRLREDAMKQGVTLIAPETIFLSTDTVYAEDVILHPHVIIGEGVTFSSHVEVLSFSHVAGVKIGTHARIGPFARLRPGSEIGAAAHIGNFVEVNRSVIGANVDVNHLSYLGDAIIGTKTNIGAGTITCNFDGGNKHKTLIGEDVFVGSNATLVAPLKIGDEALIAAGSVITENVDKGALVFGRIKGQSSLPQKGAEKNKANKAVRAARKANNNSQ